MRFDDMQQQVMDMADRAGKAEGRLAFLTREVRRALVEPTLAEAQYALRVALAALGSGTVEEEAAAMFSAPAPVEAPRG